MPSSTRNPPGPTCFQPFKACPVNNGFHFPSALAAASVPAASSTSTILLPIYSKTTRRRLSRRFQNHLNALILLIHKHFKGLRGLFEGQTMSDYEAWIDLVFLDAFEQRSQV